MIKTNERPGTRALARHIRISPYKVREVLDLVRGQHVQRAAEILRFSERDAAFVVGKVLASAVANAEHNDGLDPEELYVSACYADEGVTIKRFRPRARGRAGRIRKRTCHVTVIVSRMPDEELRRYRTKQAAEQAARRARRVAGGRAGGATGGTDAGGGRSRRLRRNRGGKDAPAASTPGLAAEDEDTQIEAVEDVAAGAEEMVAMEESSASGDEVAGEPGAEASPAAGDGPVEPAEGAPEDVPTDGADRADDEGQA
ncbi:MAG: 50S ribosomal protein L22 [Actinobacteria bacterium]|nr:50S ribosomal protein L22 [Actinomycetota bacterium]MBW3650080.1 50S ribosomal protein L22 [Actinomycetota bacterium]